LPENGTVPSGFSTGQAKGRANAAELLRQRAATMRHAIVYDRVIDADGRVEAEREFHYLTCRRCDLERQAKFIEEHE
jgi:DNA-binding GntR family transcriptional regulator